ncbi:MAG: lysylphosphatidylglycerol synthase domain-containing protein [Burkholderiaceae bacterium]
MNATREAGHRPAIDGTATRDASRDRPAPGAGRDGCGRRRAWWSGRVARGLGAGFIVLVLAAVAYAATRVQWREVLAALRDTPPTVLAGAFAIGLCSLLVYGCYDLIGRAWVGHRLTVRQVMQTAFVSYAFNLNLGSLIGGVGMRLRLYQRLGLPNDRIARVIGLALATNWLGFAAVGGVLYSLAPITLPADWKVGGGGLRVIGVMLVVLVAGYVLACAFGRRRTLGWRNHHLTLPTWRMAVLQLLVGAINWMMIGMMLYVLLRRQVPYQQVLGVYLLGALAGLLMRVPAGLGVLEAVFLTLIATPQTHHQVLAAVLAYRALYYLIPLAVAAALYVGKEVRPHRRAAATR